MKILGTGLDGFVGSRIVEFFKDRAPRPFQLTLKNAKIGKLGIKMRTFEEGVKEILKPASQRGERVQDDKKKI